MAKPPRQVDWWCGPLLGLWAVFFVVGAVPEWTYEQLRMASHVVTQRALVNSPFLLSLALAAYLAWFTYHRCREAGLDGIHTRGKTLQIAIISLAAFLPLSTESLLNLNSIMVPAWRHLVTITAAVKTLAWLYLLSILLRYYLGSGHETFVRIPSLLPSVRYLDATEETTSLPPRPEPADAAEEQE